MTDCTWKEGDLCAVLSCAEESKWCRAEVTSINAPSTPTKKKAGFLSRLLTKKSEGGEQCKCPFFHFNLDCFLFMVENWHTLLQEILASL